MQSDVILKYLKDKVFPYIEEPAPQMPEQHNFLYNIGVREGIRMVLNHIEYCLANPSVMDDTHVHPAQDRIPADEYARSGPSGP
jgi:hypothetical protein